MTETKKKSGIFLPYRTVGLIGIVWSLAFLSEKYLPLIPADLSWYGFLLWTGWNIVLPVILILSLQNRWPSSAGINVAFSALAGCCCALAGLHFLSVYIFIPGRIFSLVTFVVSAAGYLAGYRCFVRDRFHDLYNDGRVSRILRAVFFGFIAGVILSHMFPNVFISGIVFIISSVHVCIGHIILTRQVKILKDQAFAQLDEERKKKMASLDEYDEKIRRYEEEKAERERREREARERAEQARREREKAEQEYRNRQGSSASRHYFAGCNNKAELKRRYRQLCKKLHPDCPGGNAGSFLRMQSEYEMLLKTMAA
ncbi:MAG: J domain-containing protein [Lachnospiraceae bacterium]|nr:J domain-containing protein [Lachnospiraceae bacterium]